MKLFQFSCAVRIEETGELMPIAGLLTPIVEAETVTQAIHHPETVAYCETNKCVVYRVVLGK